MRRLDDRLLHQVVHLRHDRIGQFPSLGDFEELFDRRFRWRPRRARRTWRGVIRRKGQ